MKPGNAPCPDDATTMDDATGAVHPSRIDLDRNDFALDFELVFQLVAAGAERYDVPRRIQRIDLFHVGTDLGLISAVKPTTRRNCTKAVLLHVIVEPTVISRGWSRSLS